MSNIVTLNTWGKCGPYEYRWPSILSQLTHHQPHVILLQEILDMKPIRAIQDLCKLPHYAAHFEAGLATLSKFPIKKSRVVTYLTKSDREDYFRSALMTEIQSKTKSCIIINTHLSWQPEDVSIRTGQIGEILSHLQYAKHPIMIGGDLNDVPDSLPMLTLKRAGFQDLFGQLYPHDDGFTWDNRHPYIQSHSTKLPDRRIDFLFLSQSLWNMQKQPQCKRVFTQPDTRGVYPSDHYGLRAEIELFKS